MIKEFFDNVQRLFNDIVTDKTNAHTYCRETARRPSLQGYATDKDHGKGFVCVPNIL